MKMERLEIRVSKHEKEKILTVINDINKHNYKKIGYRYLIMEFVNNYLDNNKIGLEIQKKEIIKEIDKEKEKQSQAVNNISNLEIELKNIEHELNNKTLFDETIFKNNENVLKAIANVKEYIINNNVSNIENIPDNYYMQINETFKLNDKTLLKNIVKNNFNKWQLNKEIIKPDPEPSKSEILEKISNNILRAFNDKRQPIKNLNEYIQTKDQKKKIKKYSENNNLTETEINNYLMALPEQKQIKK